MYAIFLIEEIRIGSLERQFSYNVLKQNCIIQISEEENIFFSVK